MKLRMLKSAARRLPTWGACLLALAPAATDAATAVVAQTGAPAGPGQRHVLILLRELDGALPSGPYAVYRKAGTPDSGGSFTRLGVMTPTVNDAALTILLQRAAAAGLNNAGLEMMLDELSGDSGPEGTLAGKLAWALRGEFSDNGRSTQREMLVKSYPQAAMACGLGWIAQASSTSSTTFEVRQIHPATQADCGIAGRVTVSGAPQWLPAPAGAAERVDASPGGDLRVLLRWWRSPSLTASILHVKGYNVYRADRKAWIEATGAAPPANLTRDQLLAALGSGRLTLVNRATVEPDNVPDAAPPPDSTDFHFTDDNDSETLGRWDEGGVPFTNGQRLTYYVAACDFFGRPGHPSPGLDVTVCDRMPPDPPSGLRVENRYAADGAGHYLELSWNTAPAAEVRRYHVYRYSAPEAAFPDVKHPASPDTPSRIATINNPGAGRLTFSDTGTGAPALPADDGRVIWYAVRAEDDSAAKSAAGYANVGMPCGTVPGVLYSFEGPGAPEGSIATRSCRPVANLSTAPGPANDNVVRLRGVRTDASLTWVEFRETSGGAVLGRHYFPAGSNQEDHMVPLPAGVVKVWQFEARFGRRGGQRSDWVQGPAATSNVLDHTWTGNLMCDIVDGSPDGIHDPLDPGTGELEPVCGTVSPADGAASWRIYRRLGPSAPQALVTDGKFPAGPPVPVVWCDAGVPASGQNVCYFAQVFDADGNGGPITPLGCVVVSRPDTLPRPMIKSSAPVPGAEPNPAQPLVRLSWFCPRVGVERFSLVVTPPPPGATGFHFEDGVLWGEYRTARLPAGFGGDGTIFDFDVRLNAGTQYTAKVRALGTPPVLDPDAMAEGPWSEPAPIQWNAFDDSGPQLPWPARAMAGIDPIAVLAEKDLLNFGRVAIGEIPAGISVTPTGTGDTPAVVYVPSIAPYLYDSADVVAYRHETTAGARHEMVQVSPMLRTVLTQPGPPGALLIVDPFIVVKKRNAAAPGDPWIIWIRDTQPLKANRSYRYTLVRWKDDGEIGGVKASGVFTAVP